MKATEKDVKRLEIRAEGSGRKPDTAKTAAALLIRCREWYRDPENEQMYLAWKNGLKTKKES